MVALRHGYMLNKNSFQLAGTSMVVPKAAPQTYKIHIKSYKIQHRKLNLDVHSQRVPDWNFCIFNWLWLRQHSILTSNSSKTIKH